MLGPTIILSDYVTHEHFCAETGRNKEMLVLYIEMIWLTNDLRLRTQSRYHERDHRSRNDNKREIPPIISVSASVNWRDCKKKEKASDELVETARIEPIELHKRSQA